MENNKKKERVNERMMKGEAKTEKYININE